MSVVEFFADSWQASSPGLQKGLGNRIEALGELAQGLESLAASGNISGKGADAMRAYIREVHVPIVQSMLVSLYTFQTAIGVYWNGYSQVDTDGNFRLVNDEYDEHLTQLDTGMEQLQGFADDLRAIAASASHLVSLGGAGANAAERTADDLERMRLIAKTQQETWKSYEATDHGFGQVKELIAELDSTLKKVGSLTVGQGRDYQSGSFNLTLEKLGELTEGMLEYCQENQQVASDGWEALFAGYVDDVEAEAERQRKEDALWGLLWDGLQIVGGAVITVIGVVGTPFTGGFSLGLTVLGASLVVGGVNSAINHASIASTGQELNLIGMAADAAGQWYDVNVAQPAIASGDKGLQFLAGVGSGVGQVVSEAAQLNVKEIGDGLYTLATDETARSALWNQVQNIAGQVADGDTFVMGQIAGNLVPIGAAAKLSKPGNLLGKVDNFGFGKPVKISTPDSATSAMDWLKNRLGAGSVKVSDEFTPQARPLDRVDGSATKPRVDPRKAEAERLSNANLDGNRRFESALENRNNAQIKLDQITAARNQTLAELQELGIIIDPKHLTKNNIRDIVRDHRADINSRTGLSSAAKDDLRDLLDELQDLSLDERAALTARNNMSRDLGEEAAAAYREALGETEVLYRPNAVRDRFDLITQSPDGNKLIFTEAKGGNASLSSSGRKIDGESAGQGSTNYFNDLFQKDPEFRAWLDENPGVLRKLQNGEMTVEYQMVRARPDGTVETYNLLLDQSALVLR